MKPHRFIFEKGVSIQLSEDGCWYFSATSPKDKLIRIHPDKVTQTYGVRCILVSFKSHSGEDLDLLLPKHITGKLLDIAISEFEQFIALASGKDFYKVYNLFYIAGAVAYHCKVLTKIYRNICVAFSRFPLPEANTSDTAMLSRQNEAYYEFDALVTAARRVYDASRDILWEHFGPGKGSVPKSFKKCVPQCSGLPEQLKNRLITSWDTYEEKITNYRNCIQHISPIDFGFSSARLMRIKNDIWSVSLLIPDNPEVKSREKLKYFSDIDALSYSWEITTEVVNMAKEVLEAADNSRR